MREKGEREEGEGGEEGEESEGLIICRDIIQRITDKFTDLE